MLNRKQNDVIKSVHPYKKNVNTKGSQFFGIVVEIEIKHTS